MKHRTPRYFQLTPVPEGNLQDWGNVQVQLIAAKYEKAGDGLIDHGWGIS